MTGILIIMAAVLAVIGAAVAVWSIIDTRKRYYEEYIVRKRRDVGD